MNGMNECQFRKWRRIKAFVKHSGKLICFLFFIYFFLLPQEGKNLRYSSVLFTPACQFAFSMAHRITNRPAEVGMHFWGLSSLAPLSELITRASGIGPSPDRNISKDGLLMSPLGSSISVWPPLVLEECFLYVKWNFLYPSLCPLLRHIPGSSCLLFPGLPRTAQLCELSHPVLWSWGCSCEIACRLLIPPVCSLCCVHQQTGTS